MIRSIVTLLLAALAIILLPVGAATALAQPAAAVASKVEVRYGEWTDPARGGRVIPYKLYIPAGAGPFPVVVHSHGLGGNRDASTYILQAVAEAGLIVVTLQHAGSDTGLLQGGGPSINEAAVVAAGRAGMTSEAARGRYGDLPFALDQLGADPMLKGRADLTRIGMSGHSYGALSTLTAVGQRLPAMPNNTEFADPRIKAAIAYSPNKPRGDDPRLAFARVKTPMLHFTGTEDVTPFDLEKNAFKRTTPFQAIQGADQYLIILDGADHGVFGGRRALMGRLRPSGPPQMEIIKAETVLFWRAYLKDDAAARARLCDLPRRLDPAGEGYVKAPRCGPPTPIAPLDGLR